MPWKHQALNICVKHKIIQQKGHIGLGHGSGEFRNIRIEVNEIIVFFFRKVGPILSVSAYFNKNFEIPWILK